MSNGWFSRSWNDICTCWLRSLVAIESLARWEWVMAEHMYKVIELVGASSESWEKAASTVVEESAKHLKDLRIGEVTSMDMQISEGKVVAYRVKIKVSFKYHPEIQTH